MVRSARSVGDSWDLASSVVMEYLGNQGWQVQGSPREELFSRYGLPAATVETDDPLGEIVYVSATLPG